MTARDLYQPLAEPREGDQALARVANRIFRRQLNEGRPISIEQAYEDAARAMNDVARMAAEKGVEK